MQLMKTYINILFLAFFLCPSATMASGFEGDAAVQVIRVEKITINDLGYGDVKHAFADGERLVRVVARASNGRYLVAIQSNAGIVRMRGAYLDSALNVEDGIFTFYYANGRMESSGQYARGVKTGTWLRFALDGTKLAERHYTGHDTEGMLLSSGLMEKAATRPAQAEVPAKPVRRVGPKMKF